MYFREKFNIEPAFCGVNIIGIGGQNYKTFLSLIKNFNIKWFIFSDGEDKTIRTVRKAIRDVFGVEMQTLSNVIVLDNGEAKQLEVDELEDWGLGDLYRAGDPYIGGWPW